MSDGEDADDDWQPSNGSCKKRRLAAGAGAIVTGGKAIKTGMVLARAQLSATQSGVIAAQERQSALLGKGKYRKAEALAREAPVGSLATKDMPKRKTMKGSEEEFKKKFGAWMRTALVPQYVDARTLAELGAGTTLVRCASVTEQQGTPPPLVLAVTPAEHAAGVVYDGSVAFVVDGEERRPPVRGTWFEVANTGCAIKVWADAAVVSSRMVECPRLRNARVAIEEEEIWVELDSKWGSRSKTHLWGIPLRYADVLTVYSAQGSQWRNVHMHCERFKGKKNLLYTGGTRAMERLKISGIAADI